MATGQPQSIGEALFKQVTGLFEDSAPVSAFLLMKLKNDADKLQKVDAVEASVVKSAIAAYEWQYEEANYWVRNSVALRKSAVNYQNAAVTMRALNDFKNAHKYSLLAAECAPNDPELVIYCVTSMLLAGNFSGAHKIASPFRENNAELSVICHEIEQLQQAIKEIGISEGRILMEMEMACAIATANKVRINSAEHLISTDPDGGKSIYVPLKFFGDLNTELRLEAGFSAELASDEHWDPLKLSIEFAHE